MPVRPTSPRNDPKTRTVSHTQAKLFQRFKIRLHPRRPRCGLGRETYESVFKKSVTESWAAFPSYTSPLAQALSKCLNPQGLSTHRLISSRHQGMIVLSPNCISYPYVLSG